MDEMITDDMALLRQYLRENSEAAFSELVRRHVNLVYSVAMRQVADTHLAEEITQAVFIILAQKAATLDDNAILAGWLCRTARFISANALKMQRRRQHREKEAYMQSLLNESESARWMQIAPLLDGAMEQLGEKDHNAIVLRFFEGKNFKDIGREMGTSEDAVKVRVGRALEKLRRIFSRRGVVLSATLVAGMLSENAVQAAPVSLARTVSAGALAKGAVVGGSSIALIDGGLKLMAWAKAKAAMATAAVTLLAAGTVTIVVQTAYAAPPTTNVAPSTNVPVAATTNDAAAPATPPADKPATTAASDDKDLSSILKETNAYRRTKELVTYLDALPPDKISTALPEAQKSGADASGQAISFLTERWIDADPGAALAGARGMKDRYTRETMLKEIYGALAAKNPDAAITQASQIQDKQERTQAIAGIIQELARQDPAKALAYFEQTKSTLSSGMLRTLFGQWAEKDLHAATEEALQQTTGGRREVALHGILQFLIAKDPKAAMAYVEQLPPGQTRDHARESLMFTLVDPGTDKHDFHAAAEYFSNLPTGVYRNKLVREFAFQWSLDDPRSALLWYDGQFSATSSKSYQIVDALSKWAEEDPQAALGYVSGHSLPAMEKEREIENVVSGWAKRDPRAAVSWVDQLPPGAEKSDALNNAVTAWAGENPREATEYVNNLPQSVTGKADLMKTSALLWAKSDPQGALAWISGLPVGKDKDGLLDKAVEQWADEEPSRAAAYVDTLPPGSDQQKLLSSVVSGWAGYDPNAAFQWLAKFPDNPQKSDALGSLAFNWAQSDPAQASNWLLQLPTGSARDTAVRSFCSSVVDSDPASADKWAESIGNADDRQKQVTSVLKKWMQSDAASASVAVQNSSLPPDQKAALLNSKP